MSDGARMLGVSGSSVRWVVYLTTKVVMNSITFG
jgi:hypothetical protein